MSQPLLEINTADPVGCGKHRPLPVARIIRMQWQETITTSSHWWPGDETQVLIVKIPCWSGSHKRPRESHVHFRNSSSTGSQVHPGQRMRLFATEESCKVKMVASLSALVIVTCLILKTRWVYHLGIFIQVPFGFRSWENPELSPGVLHSQNLLPAEWEILLFSETPKPCITCNLSSEIAPLFSGWSQVVSQPSTWGLVWKFWEWLSRWPSSASTVTCLSSLETGRFVWMVTWYRTPSTARNKRPRIWHPQTGSRKPASYPWLDLEQITSATHVLFFSHAKHIHSFPVPSKI
jgi:hypothetical protein